MKKLKLNSDPTHPKVKQLLTFLFSQQQDSPVPRPWLAGKLRVLGEDPRLIAVLNQAVLRSRSAEYFQVNKMTGKLGEGMGGSEMPHTSRGLMRQINADIVCRSSPPNRIQQAKVMIRSSWCYIFRLVKCL